MTAKKYKLWFILAAVPAICLLCSPLHGAVSSSQNYSLAAHAFDQAGLKSQAGSLALVSATGQNAPIGESSSSNYTLYAGLLSAWRPICDTDGDGVTDNVENSGCMDPLDQDTDDDGIPDGLEDLDADGVVDPGETDPCSYDSDGDGVGDGTETGLTYDDVGPDTDPLVFQPDLDPGDATDPNDPDSDDDGKNDGFYDPNGTGRTDPWEADQGEKFPPSADAGPDRTSQTGVQTILDGGNSRDADGAITAWTWTRTSGPADEPADGNAVQTFFTPSQSGAYVLN